MSRLPPPRSLRRRTATICRISERAMRLRNRYELIRTGQYLCGAGRNWVANWKSCGVMRPDSRSGLSSSSALA